MADKKKPNVFKRIANGAKEVRLELKRVIWPSKEKLKSTSAVVLAVILFFAVFLSAITFAGKWIFEKVGFYDADVTTTTAIATEAPAPVESEVVVEEGVVEEATETTVEESEA